MITFWIIAAVMLIAAVLCAVVPLMQRESAADAPKVSALSVSLYQWELADADADLRTGALSPDQYASVRGDIEQRVLDDTAASPSLARRSTPRTATRAATCAVLIALFPSAACLLYLKLGEPAALKLNNPLDDSLGVSHDMSSMSVEMMVSRLAFRLRDHAPDPRDAAAWATLARSYTVLERPTDAVTAYTKAVSLDPGDAALRADFADAIASADDGRLAGRASEEIAAALAIDSADPKALALAASAAFDARDYAHAIGYWRRLLATLKADSLDAMKVQKNIDAAVGLSAVTVDIRLADGANVASDAAVIVTARMSDAPASTNPASAPNTLLAERRLSAGELPTTIVLDDSLAINATDTLSAHQQVVVAARIVSVSGTNDLTGRGDAKGLENRHASVVIAAPSP
ncbi:c-type cytochrome biogenesis protein CcmI [Burkholderia sp. S171]|uniref:c-type cytochrome biogenesis protein CcmI n=1 Tax=Burkholderia sp. S171 TaxID=1641860 RepID=UPI00131B1676|nr:c-type cytochrome biogenesis protein CcmI [Burkholderia sp. S171]